MTTTIKLRRDTSSNWTNSNPILAAGEPGVETDTLRVKYGDGSSTWTNLAYSAVGNATYANTAGSATTATTAVSAATATSATSALTAGTVTTNAQPNITSVGTLTNLVTSGNISGSSLNISGGASLGNVATANYFVGALHGTANAAQVAATVTTNAQPNITSVGILTDVVSTGNITTTGFFVGDGGFLTNVSGGGSTYSNANVATYLPTYDGNVLGLHVTSNTQSISPSTGAIMVEGGIGAKGNLHTGGEVHTTGNIDCNGNTIFVGPFADATGITGPVIVGFSAGEDYIQAVLKNSRGNGSSDWTSVANEGNENEGWTSLGVSGSTFNDPNYTITKPGDGYVLAAGLLGSGGNLVFATGATGTVKDIVFATGGFSASNEFARIDHANAALHLTKTGATIKFPDGTVQTTANGNPFNQNLNTSNTVQFSSVLSAGMVFDGTSLISQTASDTGLNIRSDVNKKPIYIYNYGSDGQGTNACEIDVTETSVDIYAQYGTANQSLWSFRNIDSGEILLGPNMILGSVLDTDQLISRNGNHSISLVSKDSISGISVYGAEATGVNPGTNIPLAKKVIIYSGKDPSTEGRIELDAGGLVSNSRASIYMGSIEDPIRNYPSTGTPVASLETNIEILGGINCLGDISISAGYSLGITGNIVFQNGSIQNTAWTGTVDAANVTGLGNISTISLDGNVSNVLYGDGTFGSVPNPFNQSLNTTDGPNFASVNTDIVYSNSLSTTSGSFGHDTTDLRISATANVKITTDNMAANLTWNFGSNGNITFPDTTVQETAFTSAKDSLLANALQWTTAPATNTSTGTAGQVAYDAGGNLYVCVATDTWAKFTGSTSW